MLSKVFTCALYGIRGIPLSVEVDISDGLPAFDIIGLPDAAVREAKERVRAALKNSGYTFPYSRITVNLAPAGLKKEGSAFDLAIAVGLLAASGQIPSGGVINNAVFTGELSLDGSLRPITGCLAISLALTEESSLTGKELILPAENATEAALVKTVTVRGAASLTEVVNHCCGAVKLPSKRPLQLELAGSPIKMNLNMQSASALIEKSEGEPDFDEVKGQESAKRALEVAAAGGHNLLLFGPPGSGKTMLARRLASILPQPSLDEVLEITRIHSVAGLLDMDKPVIGKRPFRSPHHNASTPGIIGGGLVPRPGEITLAHKGVLFFDELPEYKRDVLEALRQPLEEKTVTVTRSQATICFPADFIFIASMNPCPCGYYGDPFRECRCSPYLVERYRSSLSGPLLDRIDLQVEVPALKLDEVEKKKPGESSSAIRTRVEKARQAQLLRYDSLKITCNSDLTGRHIEQFCHLNAEARNLLRQSFQALQLSMRAHDRIIKVARTIADLDGSGIIASAHVAEAVQYRSLDRQDQTRM